MAGKKRNVEFVDNPTLEQFSMMVENHDPTYEWCEDESFRDKESRKAEIIGRARDFVGEEAAVKIWNDAMRKKIVPSFVDEFTWSKKPR